MYIAYDTVNAAINTRIFVLNQHVNSTFKCKTGYLQNVTHLKLKKSL